tara:strand:- start:521 stop:973 length:453 start_codon:yes stop_codon:yes gene_type:complete
VIDVYDAFSLDSFCYEALNAVTGALEVVDTFDTMLQGNPEHSLSRVDHVKAVRLIALQELASMQGYYEPHSESTLNVRHRACRRVVNSAVDKLLSLELPATVSDEDDPVVVSLVQELCSFIESLYTALRTDDDGARSGAVSEYCDVEHEV